MSGIIRNVLRSHPLIKISSAMQQGRLTVRHIVFISVLVVVLWILLNSSVSPSSFKLPEGDLSSAQPEPDPLPDVWTERANQVKEAFQHAYHGYERHAWIRDEEPYDELSPVTGIGVNPFNGWGVTMYDSLDTMLVMGLQDEFKRSVPRVAKANFTQLPYESSPLFETVIRYLGGLLSGYALSNETILLRRADDLGRMLSPAFNTSSGLPYYGVNTVSGVALGPIIGILAEIASCQLEYTYLAKATGKKEYYHLADRIIRTLAKANLTDFDGFAPVTWSISKGQPWVSDRGPHGEVWGNTLSIGSQADSAHEYMLKQYLLTAQKDKDNLGLYINATNFILKNLLYLSPTRHLLYVTDSTDTLPDPAPSNTFEHLSCFLPGLFALGAHSLPLSELPALPTLPASTLSLRDLHLWAASGLAQTCYLTYADQPSGLGPDIMHFAKGGTRWLPAMEQWKKSGARGAPPGVGEKLPVVYSEEERINGPTRGHTRDYVLRSRRYLLRPETVESLHILWLTTGDPIWRERGWAIFQAIEKQLKTPYGYACALTVEVSPVPLEDSMPSYFLAETLKYLYILFHREDLIPLDKYVFNTEAHPFPIFQWTEQERKSFGIQ